MITIHSKKHKMINGYRNIHLLISALFAEVGPLLSNQNEYHISRQFFLYKKANVLYMNNPLPGM